MNKEIQRTTPTGLITYAIQFRKAALATDDKLGMEDGYEIIAPVPVLYLIAHSIELSIKAFLLHKGLTIRKLKKYGHDISKTLKKAKELGLTSNMTISEIEEETLVVLNALYTTKQLNYIVTGFKQFPVFGPLQSLSKNLIDSVGKAISYPDHLLQKAC